MSTKIPIGFGSSGGHLSHESKFAAPPTINEKEVFATFLSTRIGTNSEAGEFEQDWYYNSTRVLIHRLLRTPETRSRRRVVVSLCTSSLLSSIGPSHRKRRTVETR